MSGEPENAGAKMLSVLSALGELGLDRDGEVRLTDLITATGYTRPTVHRLLATLKAQGFVAQEASGPYSFGPRMYLLAQQCFGRRDIRRMALPHMQALSRETGHTVHLGVREGGEVVYIDKQEPPGGMAVSSAIGQRRPLQFTALGKVLLAFSPQGTAEAVLPPAWPARTERSLTTRDGLLAQMDSIRARGFAFDDEESDPGFRCVAAPIVTRGGAAVAALSLTTVASRIPTDQLEAFGRRIRAVAEDISRVLNPA